jgi:hypothetical protein
MEFPHPWEEEKPPRIILREIKILMKTFLILRLGRRLMRSRD